MRTAIAVAHAGKGIRPRRASRARNLCQANRIVKRDSCQYFTWFCAGVFLLGYLPGILAGQSGTSVIGQQIAAYYTDVARLSHWSELFSSQAAAFFLQLFSVWLFGFTAFGPGLLLLLFAGKGLFLGFCASQVLCIGGTKKLIVYWISSCLPNVLLLFILLWLAGYAVHMSHGLFQSIFLGGAPRGQLPGNARRLTVRFLLCLPFSVLICGLCSLFVILFIRLIL